MVSVARGARGALVALGMNEDRRGRAGCVPCEASARACCVPCEAPESAGWRARRSTADACVSFGLRGANSHINPQT